MAALTIVQFEIIIIATMTAVACSIPGTFLVLRRMSMLSDAISHSVLLGIVCAYFFVRNFDSPFLVLAAGATGLLTVLLVEAVIKTSLVKEDAAMGLVYPLMFSIAVILISIFADKVHLDTDTVLMGELVFTPLNRMMINGVDLGPAAAYQVGGMMLINIVLTCLFYKDIKLILFDENYAYTIGYSPKRFMTMLMAVVSFTTVVAFEVVGAIMVVAFIVGPAVISSFFTKRLWSILLTNVLVCITVVLCGYFTAHKIDVSVAGSITTFIGVVFILVFLFSPQRGLLFSIRSGQKKTIELGVDALLVHLWQHEIMGDYDVENTKSSITEHFGGDAGYIDNIFIESLQKNYILVNDDHVKLQEKGKLRAHKVLAQ